MSKVDLPLVLLGEVAKPIARPVNVLPGQSYRTLGVKWWGEGAYERETIDGSKTAASQLYEVHEGDLIINKIWVRHGSIGIVPVSMHGCAGSGEFPTFDLDSDRVLPRWIHWYSKTREMWSKCDALSQGTSGKNRIKPDKFLTVTVPLPPLAEQRRIVAKIEQLASKIEEARGLKLDALTRANVFVPAVLSQFFNFGPTSSLPPNWSWQRLSNLLIGSKDGIMTGPFGTLLQKSEVTEEGVPILGIQNIAADRFISGFRSFLTDRKAAELGSYRLRGGDIVVARSGTVGRSCVVPDELQPMPIMSTNLLRIRVDRQKISPELLCRIFNGTAIVERHKSNECRGSTRIFFTQKILNRLSLPLPPLPEQRRIVAYLDDLQVKVDQLKALQAQTAAELDAFLPSILDRAFRGEL